MSHDSTSGAIPQGARMVHCVKLGRTLPGLTFRPFPNDLGERVYEQVSAEGWAEWIGQSKMLINEYRLNLSSPDARTFLMAECEKFFFGEGATPPPDYQPPSS
jgi:Fe-S cluster biosynthesis and repair protein YggX